MTQSCRMTLVTLLGLALLSSPALAFDKDHGKGHDRDDRKESRDHDRDRDRHHAGHDRDRDRDDERDGRPPGWSHGRKEGWKKSNCDLPPGLAKKNPDCGESRHEHRTVVISPTHRDTPVRSRTTITRVPTRTVTTTTTTTTKKTDDKIRNPADLILKRKTTVTTTKN